MAARPLYAFSAIIEVSFNGTTPAGSNVIYRWTADNNRLPLNAAGIVGVKIVGNMHRVTTGGCFFAAVLGGTSGASGGTSTAFHLVTANGPFASPRLELPLAGLFAGVDVEYLKIKAYYEGAVQGGVPVLQSPMLALSGDPLAEPAAVGGLPPPDPRALDLFGVDIDVMTDLPRSFVLASGFKNLGNAIVRRLSTPRGALAAFGDDPDYGLDLTGKLNAHMTEAQLQGLGGEIEEEVTKDERIAAADVALTFDHATSTLTVVLEMQTALGPFRLVLAVSQLTVAILNADLVG